MPASVNLDVLVVRLGAHASLDFVRRREERSYLVVLADRADIGGRWLVRLPYDAARACARFLAELAPPATHALPLTAPCAAVIIRDVQHRCFTFSFERLGPIEQRWRARLPFGNAARVAHFLALPPALPLPAPTDVVVAENPLASAAALEETDPEAVPEIVQREHNVTVSRVRLPPRDDGD